MFLKNRNIIFKIRRSKVTDYAALMHYFKYWAGVEGQPVSFSLNIDHVVSMFINMATQVAAMIYSRFYLVCQQTDYMPTKRSYAQPLVDLNKNCARQRLENREMACKSSLWIPTFVV